MTLIQKSGPRPIISDSSPSGCTVMWPQKSSCHGFVHAATSTASATNAIRAVTALMKSRSRATKSRMKPTHATGSAAMPMYLRSSQTVLSVRLADHSSAA